MRLPEIAGYAAGFIDHLLRTSVSLSVTGDRIRAEVLSSRGTVPAGQPHLFAEDAQGRRRELQVSRDERNGAVFSAIAPSGTRRVSAFLRGEDEAGTVVAFGDLALTMKR